MHRATAFHGIHHTTLPAGDLERAERFYVELLGATLVRRLDRAAFLRLRPDREADADADNSPLHLALRFGSEQEVHVFLQRRHRPGPAAPHPHTALRVEPAELDRLTASLRAHGVAVDGPRRLGPPGHASVYFRDPAGNLLELCTLDYPRPVPDGPPDLAALAVPA
jgi:catechol 2,3-dioxygenase-like lactoylglutathione lyase family enzyme